MFFRDSGGRPSIYLSKTDPLQENNKKYKEITKKIKKFRSERIESSTRSPLERETSTKSFERGGECVHSSQGTPPGLFTSSQLYMLSLFSVDNFCPQVEQIATTESQYADLQNVFCNPP